MSQVQAQARCPRPHRSRLALCATVLGAVLLGTMAGPVRAQATLGASDNSEPKRLPALTSTSPGANPVAAWHETWPLAPQVADFAVATGWAEGPRPFALRFQSSPPASLAQALKPGQVHPPQTVAGQLRLANMPGRQPAVVLMHGSGGVYSALLQFWPQRLAEAGIATLVVDSFGPRGVRSTAEDQSLVPREADVADAFAALRLLATHPRIDASRIAVMGFSRGGSTAWRTALLPLAAALNPGAPASAPREAAATPASASRPSAANSPPAPAATAPQFAAHVMVYSGGCAGLRSVRVKPGLFSAAPMLWLHGSADDYAPAAACEAFAGQIEAAGTPSRFVSLPGAHHKFDADSEKLVFAPRVQSAQAGCPLAWDLDAAQAVDQRSGHLLTARQARELGAALCNKQGAHLQGSYAARETATQEVLGFLRSALALGPNPAPPAAPAAPQLPAPVSPPTSPASPARTASAP